MRAKTAKSTSSLDCAATSGVRATLRMAAGLGEHGERLVPLHDEAARRHLGAEEERVVVFVEVDQTLVPVA
jgi:hypothetical protein